MITRTLLLLSLAFGTAIQSTNVAEAGDLSFSAELNNTETTHPSLAFRGKLAEFPAGTWVDIRFMLKGNAQHIDWYRALVKNEAFDGKTNAPPRKTAPGTYTVEFWLKVKLQNKPVKRWFQLNRGYSSSHEELLDTVLIKIGSEAERTKFQDGIKSKLRAQLESLKAMYAKSKGIVEAGKSAKSEEEGMEAYGEDLTAFQALCSEYFDWVKEYMSIPLEKERYAFESLIDTCGKMVEKSMGVEVEDKVEHLQERWSRFLKKLEPAIVAREPLKPADAPKLKKED